MTPELLYCTVSPLSSLLGSASTIEAHGHAPITTIAPPVIPHNTEQHFKPENKMVPLTCLIEAYSSMRPIITIHFVTLGSMVGTCPYHSPVPVERGVVLAAHDVVCRGKDASRHVLHGAEYGTVHASTRFLRRRRCTSHLSSTTTRTYQPTFHHQPSHGTRIQDARTRRAWHDASILQWPKLTQKTLRPFFISKSQMQQHRTTVHTVCRRKILYTHGEMYRQAQQSFSRLSRILYCTRLSLPLPAPKLLLLRLLLAAHMRPALAAPRALGDSHQLQQRQQ